MPGRIPWLKGGPPTYEAMSAVTGGQLVEATTGTTTDPSLAPCQPASNTSLKVLGMATKDAVPAASQAASSQGNTSYAGSFPFVDASVPSPTVAVENDCWGRLHYTTAANFRDPICASGSGNVRKWLTGTDADEARIGWCAQPGGVSSGADGLSRIRV